MGRGRAAATGSLPVQGFPAPLGRELATAYPRLGRPVLMPVLSLVLERSRSARWFDWAGERFSAHSVGDHRRRRLRWIPLGRLVPLPTPPPDAYAQVAFSYPQVF